MLLRLPTAFLVTAILLGACVAKQTAAPVTKPLRIDVRKENGAYNWFLNGGCTSADVDSLRKATSDFAEVVDERVGLTGRDVDGVSHNVVIFTAPPDAPAMWFLQAAEQLVSHLLYRVEAHLVSARGERVPVELPRDEGLSYFYNSLHLAVTVSNGTIQFAIGLTPEDQQSIEGATLKLSELDGGDWNSAIWQTAAAELSRSLQESEKRTTGRRPGIVRDILIAVEDDLPWGALFIVLDALDRASTDDGRDGPTFVAWPLAPIEGEVETEENR